MTFIFFKQAILFVIPAKAGIQSKENMDSCFRRNDILFSLLTFNP